MRQSSDEEEEQCQPTPSLDHAASRLVKISILANLSLEIPHLNDERSYLCIKGIQFPCPANDVWLFSHSRCPSLYFFIALSYYLMTSNCLMWHWDNMSVTKKATKNCKPISRSSPPLSECRIAAAATNVFLIRDEVKIRIARQTQLFYL